VNARDEIEDAYPHAGEILNGFYPYFEDGLVDPGHRLDSLARSALSTGALGLIAGDLQRLLKASPDEHTAEENLMPWLSQTGVPDGPTYREFLKGILARVRQALDDPASIPDPGPEERTKTIPRMTWYLTKENGDRVATDVLRAHERQLRAWAEDPGGWWRQQYYVPDLGYQTGAFLSCMGQEYGDPVFGATVVMRRDHETGQPFIMHTYPEITMATDVRQELPDLCHLFGGYFGLGCNDEGGPLTTQHNFQSSTKEPARGRVRQQLDVLLTQEDDDALRLAVEHLGGYMAPVAMRAWIQRLRWRMDAFDWSRDQTGPSGQTAANK
jgi:hypothetical protein